MAYIDLGALPDIDEVLKTPIVKPDPAVARTVSPGSPAEKSKNFWLVVLGMGALAAYYLYRQAASER